MALFRSQQIARSEHFDGRRLCGYALLTAIQKSSFVGFPKFDRGCFPHLTGEFKVSASTVAALLSKMAMTGQRIAMVDVVLLLFTAFPYLP